MAHAERFDNRHRLGNRIGQRPTLCSLIDKAPGNIAVPRQRPDDLLLDLERHFKARPTCLAEPGDAFAHQINREPVTPG